MNNQYHIDNVGWYHDGATDSEEGRSPVTPESVSLPYNQDRAIMDSYEWSYSRPAQSMIPHGTMQYHPAPVYQCDGNHGTVEYLQHQTPYFAQPANPYGVPINPDWAGNHGPGMVAGPNMWATSDMPFHVQDAPSDLGSHYAVAALSPGPQPSQREKNRIAASKCRQKQKRDETSLQNQEKEVVMEHRKRLADLAQLKAEVYALKREIIQQGDCPCELMREYIRKRARNI